MSTHGGSAADPWGPWGVHAGALCGPCTQWEGMWTPGWVIASVPWEQCRRMGNLYGDPWGPCGVHVGSLCRPRAQWESMWTPGGVIFSVPWEQCRRMGDLWGTHGAHVGSMQDHCAARAPNGRACGRLVGSLSPSHWNNDDAWGVCSGPIGPMACPCRITVRPMRPMEGHADARLGHCERPMEHCRRMGGL
eukprot:gene9573-biopygen2515